MIKKPNSSYLTLFLCTAFFLLVASFFPRSQEPKEQQTEFDSLVGTVFVEQDEQEPVGGVGIEHVFQKLRFDRPVQVTHDNKNEDLLYVVEQAGVIHTFSIADHSEPDLEKQTERQRSATSSVFMDISDRISRVGNEEGLIGLAFHPDFKNNGEFFVHYSSKVKDMHEIIARFKTKEVDGRIVGDPASEEILLEQKQPYRNHNGGSIEFGKDGCLYITFGDGGSANDPHGNGQNLNTWLGTILRIDVNYKDKGLAYAIPRDNPFVGQEDAKPEIYAFGLRNVWRFSFDRKTGELWAADVGQNRFEEIDIIKKGGNYGWNRMEADSVFNAETELAQGEHRSPVAVYGREWGWSVTGGFVYRGKQYPQLDGRYFYGDYVSGNLWQIAKDENGQYQNKLVRRTGRSISSFGEDFSGEVYLCSFDGRIYQIVPSAQPENVFASWPKKLSETGLYESTAKKVVSKKLIPYEINAPFWSDHAEKNRYLLIPDGKQLKYRENGTWEMPIGTTIVKDFKGFHMRGMRMLETRLIKRTEKGWEAATYVWNPRENDADLVPEGKQFELIQPNRQVRRMDVNSWHAPSSSECSSCHVDASGYVLGLTTAQLNRKLSDSGKNQILQWNEKGIVDLPDGFDIEKAQAFVSPSDAKQPVNDRARVYLDVNCAMCHQPNGPGNANIDLRFATDSKDMGIINVDPAQGNLHMRGMKLILPGTPEKSVVLHRINTLGAGRMPTVASNQVDIEAVKLLYQWIKEMDPE